MYIYKYILQILHSVLGAVLINPNNKPKLPLLIFQKSSFSAKSKIGKPSRRYPRYPNNMKEKTKIYFGVPLFLTRQNASRREEGF